jgi:hypothetical protein
MRPKELSEYQEFEEYVRKVTNGRLAPNKHEFDVITANGTKIEVKFSITVGTNQAKCRGLLGDRRIPRKYDQLIWGIVSDLETEYLLFDLPYSWVEHFCAHHAGRTLNVGLDPETITSRLSYELWTEYRVTEEQLTTRYGHIRPKRERKTAHKCQKTQ